MAGRAAGSSPAARAIALNSPSKSSCWSGSSSSSASRALLLALGHDHLPHLGLAVARHEHVLGAAQADALGAELARLGARPRGCRRWCARPRVRSSSAHPSTVWNCVADTSGSSSSHVVGGDHAGAAVDRRSVSPSPSSVSPTRTVLAIRSISSVAGSRHARLSHPARHQRGVAGLAALRGEDALRGVEAVHVVGLGERAHQDHVATVLRGAPRPPPR